MAFYKQSPRHIICFTLLTCLLVPTFGVASQSCYSKNVDLFWSYQDKNRTPQEKLEIMKQVTQACNGNGLSEKEKESLKGNLTSHNLHLQVFDAIVANNDYKANTQGSAASEGCKANGYWLSRLYEDLHILEESFSMMTEEQKAANRKITNKKTADQTRAEEYAAFKQLIQNVINKRLKNMWGKLAWATMKTKNFVCNKTTQRVAGAAALITLGYLAHRKGLDRKVVSTVSNGVTGAYETVLSETARNAIAVAAQKSAHAVVHTTVKAVEVAKKAGSKTVDVAKNVYAYVVGFLKRRAFIPVK